MPYWRIEDSKKLQRLLDAVLLLEADVELSIMLRHFIEVACELVGARYGALGVLNETRSGLERFITVGLDEDERAAIGAPPSGRGVLGLLITEPGTLRLDDLTAHPVSYGFPANHPPMHSLLGVPIRLRDDVYGNLYLTDKQGGERFTDDDAAAAEALALAAGIAIENARLHDRVRLLGILKDRERIGRDLHDRVIQRLYATGLSLQSAIQQPELAAMQERVSRAVDELDDTMTDIRSAIFELGDATADGGLRRALLLLAQELAPMLGVRPDVSFYGEDDGAVPTHVADHVMAVAREALTNAGRHASATSYRVELTVGDDLVLEVLDDGTGIVLPTPTGGLGLANMRGRALALGGTFEICPDDGGGTRVRWRVPY